MCTAGHGGCLGYFCCGCVKASGKSKSREERLVWLRFEGPVHHGVELEVVGGGRLSTLVPKHGVLVLRQLFLPFNQFRVQAQGMVPPALDGFLHHSVPDTLAS